MSNVDVAAGARNETLASDRRLAMCIRDLKLGRVKAWPPVWKAAADKRLLLGEEGILAKARVRSYDSLTIRVHHDGEEHAGLFVWDGPPSPQLLADLMNRAVGNSMADVGNLDLPEGGGS
jgi:hypothetical protein